MAASNALARFALPVVIGVIVGGGSVELWHRNASAATTSGAAGAEGRGEDLAALRSDVAKLKANAPSQSHTMSDVGHHWTNLFFAAEKKNWPLARFYFEETRQHILWTIRIKPTRIGPDGNPLDLAAIFEGVDNSAFKAVSTAIDQKSDKDFVAAYRMTLEACYGCHKAAGKPYLRPSIPTAPTQTLINLDGAATWPQ